MSDQEQENIDMELQDEGDDADVDFTYLDGNGDIWDCPVCAQPMEVNPDGAFCETCNDYYEWADLMDADEE